MNKQLKRASNGALYVSHSGGKQFYKERATTEEALAKIKERLLAYLVQTERYTVTPSVDGMSVVLEFGAGAVDVWHERKQRWVAELIPEAEVEAAKAAHDERQMAARAERLSKYTMGQWVAMPNGKGAHIETFQGLYAERVLLKVITYGVRFKDIMESVANGEAVDPKPVITQAMCWTDDLREMPV